MRLVPERWSRWRKLAIALSALAVLGAAPTVISVSIQAAAAATVTLPDMQLKVPTNQISIGTNPSTGHRQLQFTHITWDAGTGPFEIDPSYNSATGTASFVQAIYNSPSEPGHVAARSRSPAGCHGGVRSALGLPVPPHPVHSQPGKRGWLCRPGGGNQPEDGLLHHRRHESGRCAQYARRDVAAAVQLHQSHQAAGLERWLGRRIRPNRRGQPIDLTGVPDGTYYLAGIVDPEHILTESDNTNDVTVTELAISNSTVTVLGQSTGTSTPPTVSIISPAAGSAVSGTVSLSASAAASGSATITSVQWMLNGQPLSGPLPTAPYSYSWNVGSIPLGSYTLSAQAIDSNGNVGTAAETVQVTGTVGGLTIDQSVKAAGTGTATANLGAVPAGETLLAFVASDGSSGGGQTATVSGGGLTWTRIQRENAQLGDSEIWTASVPSSMPGLAVTSTLGQKNGQQLEVLALSGSGGVGASAVAAAAKGAPSVSLTTKAAGSLSFAVGNDWDTNTARTLSAGQTMLAETQASTGDDYWVQMSTSAAAAAGQNVTLSDTAPTGDRWNFAAVEVVPGNGDRRRRRTRPLRPSASPTPPRARPSRARSPWRPTPATTWLWPAFSSCSTATLWALPLPRRRTR